MCVLWGLDYLSVSPIGWSGCMCVLWGLEYINVLNFAPLLHSH